MTCENEGGPVECMWNEGVRFVGGDMNVDDRQDRSQPLGAGRSVMVHRVVIIGV